MDLMRLPAVLCLACAFLASTVPGAAAEVSSCEFLDLDDPCAVRDAAGRAMLTFGAFDANDELVWARGFESLDDWLAYARNDPCLADGKTGQVGWRLSGGKEDLFWQLRAIVSLCPECGAILEAIESRPAIYDGTRRVWLTPRVELTTGENRFDLVTAVVFWNPRVTSAYGGGAAWDDFPPLVALAHELVHAYQRIAEDRLTYTSPLQVPAVKYENLMRQAFLRKVPDSEGVRPRPGNAGFYLVNEFRYLFDDLDWADWSPSYVPLLDVFVEP